ncbi:acetoacetate decarboxylase family protein [Pseudonocardia sp. WMMC193]|uniref:acetoacetate decarboxylase family protein n=1 Tax=Pseudonocardia sp. WMMC193 TaxID=2911965 RepID=UPI001F182787|nr:acetoacetate decarboxylase family protein [Pseudonocardia sp. WMMC193]MCF7551509.1 acetoacetate decarboxylase family protein [Pseudonocardia sp. WMMC193]
MATRLEDGSWEIRGERLTFPVRIGDAAAACAVYPVRASRVALPPALRPVAVAGWTVAVVGLVRYRVNDLGTYDELALAYPVRRGADTGIHISELPVTEEFTREAGAALWGLPKWVGEASLEFTPTRATGVLAHAGRHVLTLALSAALPLPFPVRGSVTAFGDDGRLASPVHARLRGIRIGRGAALVPGHGHPMADELRALSRRPLLTASVAHLAFDMDPAR